MARMEELIHADDKVKPTIMPKTDGDICDVP